MKKIFISMPMNGKSDKQIKADLEQIKRKINDKCGHVKFIDTYFEDSALKDPIVMLGKSIMLMNDADLIFFADGWKSARGCRIEHDVAYQYEKKCIYEEYNEIKN